MESFEEKYQELIQRLLNNSVENLMQLNIERNYNLEALENNEAETMDLNDQIELEKEGIAENKKMIEEIKQLQGRERVLDNALRYFEVSANKFANYIREIRLNQGYASQTPKS